MTQVSTATRTTISKWLSALFLFMALGTAIELYLLDHYEDFWQIIPLVIFFLSVIVFALLHFFRKTALRSLFVILLVLSALSGLLGLYFHLNANLEFESELHPTQTFADNLLAAFSGALPALAPASMIVFALIGYIYYLHINKQT